MQEKQKKQFIFFLLIIIIVAALLSALTFAEQLSQNFIYFALLGVFLLLIWRFEVILFLKEYQRAIIYRYGKVQRVGGPGWTLLVPGVESYDAVDLRTKTVDVPKQEVITRDSIELLIDAVIYLRIKKDPQSVIDSIVEVEDYSDAAKVFIIAALRNKIGNMVLSDVIANIGSLNSELKDELLLLTKNWGLDVVEVEIKDVEIPKVILEAMHAEKAAIQEKLARIEKAKAHKEEIIAVREAAEELTPSTLNYYYIKALEQMAQGKSTKLIFPMEISRLASGIAGKLAPSDQKNFEETVAPYKHLLEQYVSSAVKKAKTQEKTKEIKIEEEKKVPKKKTTVKK